MKTILCVLFSLCLSSAAFADQHEPTRAKATNQATNEKVGSADKQSKVTTPSQEVLSISHWDFGF